MGRAWEKAEERKEHIWYSKRDGVPPMAGSPSRGGEVRGLGVENMEVLHTKARRHEGRHRLFGCGLGADGRIVKILSGCKSTT